MVQFCFCHQMSYQKYFSIHRFFWNSDSSKWFLICNIVYADGGFRYPICIWRDRRTRGVRNLHRKVAEKGLVRKDILNQRNSVCQGMWYMEKSKSFQISGIYPWESDRGQITKSLGYHIMEFGLGIVETTEFKYFKQKRMQSYLPFRNDYFDDR